MIVICDLICKFFYIGKFPYFPGTVASFIGLIVWIFIPHNITFRVFIILLTWIIGHYAVSFALKDSNDSDPPSIVIDEIIGIWISCIFIYDNFFLFFLAFFIFRFLDILKPSFIYSVQQLKGSWGIIMDDVLAGILTSICIIFMQL